MDKDTKQRLDGYLELLDEISEKTDDVKTALALLQEVSKDRRMEQISEEQGFKKGDTPATDNQKAYMNDLGIEFPKNVSRKDASVLIKEELAKAE